tara:strand:+ start:26 stop:466 length:441 start_codon:yes stop_codon:yes gene_type:complete
MKYISIILMSFFLFNNVRAKEYIFNGYGISKQYTIKVSDKFKFSSYTSEGMWDDSNGDYGNEKCSGYVKQIKKKIELEVICENVNQENEIFWNSRIRKSDKGGGIGQMEILNGTGKYKKFIGLVCPYGVNYKENYAWLKAKCKTKN